ncbi:MAG: hypothetical protein ACREMY_31325, partial [bacterium]
MKTMVSNNFIGYLTAFVVATAFPAMPHAEEIPQDVRTQEGMPQDVRTQDVHAEDFHAQGLHAQGLRTQDFEGLGFLPGGNHSSALAVNADGSIVVGHSIDEATGMAKAFRWTAGGMAGFAILGGENSRANGVSSDGTVVVGQVQDAITGKFQAFRRSPTSGIMKLGALPGAT